MRACQSLARALLRLMEKIKKNVLRPNNNSIGGRSLLVAGISLSTPKEISKAVLLFLMMTVVGVMESTVVALIIPLVQIMIKPEVLEDSEFFSTLAHWLEFEWSAELFPWLAGLLIVLILASSLATLLITWLMDRESEKARNRLGRQLILSLLEAPYTWYLSKNTGVLARQVFADIRIWRNDFLQSILYLAQAIVMTCLPAATAVALVPSEGLLTIAAVMLVGASVILLLRPRIQRLVRLQKNNMDQTMRTLLQILTGIREAKISNRSAYFASKFDSHHERGNHYTTKQRLLNQISPLIVLAFGQVGFIGAAVILWSSGLSGAEITAQLAMLAVVVSRVIPSLNRGFVHYTTFISSQPYVRGLLEIIEEIYNASSETDAGHAKKVPPDWSSLKLEDVNVTYPNAHAPSLVGINLRLERGKRYGIVGKSGAGKSTLVNLLIGMIHPSSGRVLLNSSSLHDFNMRSWWEKIGYVPQDVFILDEDLLSNIAFGEAEENIDAKRLEEAINSARLDTVISELPHGVRTPMGERGRRLSGGQAQRVAIARALYRKPDMLLLDEATSALDSVVERDIQASFDELSEDVLAIAVAHRVTSLRNCHSIILLDSGRVVDMGGFDELFTRNILFRELAAERSSGDPV